MASADESCDRTLTELLRRCPQPAVPDGMEQRVRQLVRRRRALQAMCGALAASVVLGFAALAIWQPDVPQPVAVAPMSPTPERMDPIREVAVLANQGLPRVAPVPGEKEWMTVLNDLCEGRLK